MRSGLNGGDGELAVVNEYSFGIGVQADDRLLGPAQLEDFICDLAGLLAAAVLGERVDSSSRRGG